MFRIENLFDVLFYKRAEKNDVQSLLIYIIMNGMMASVFMKKM